ncbi:MAG: hypothetical protein C4B59_07590 [Candidatus Methanogaster sp.]|uniref:Uncharacterized protein n=1 Tax=Candidatus Methanogaster sp. TaxID=3386292 RepID=A0AC61L363_9EURY|nr:MAG: hypothetical protein C4B59_07590 [ANME-2 cluster archaeon]
MNKIKELEGGKKMEEERANGLYWEEIRQTVAGLSAFPEHYRAEVPGGWLVLSVLHLSDRAGTGITFFPDPHHEWTVKADDD